MKTFIVLFIALCFGMSAFAQTIEKNSDTLLFPNKKQKPHGWVYNLLHPKENPATGQFVHYPTLGYTLTAQQKDLDEFMTAEENAIKNMSNLRGMYYRSMVYGIGYSFTGH